MVEIVRKWLEQAIGSQHSAIGKPVDEAARIGNDLDAWLFQCLFTVAGMIRMIDGSDFER